MRSLIINADDFGFDQETCATTVDCFEAGLLTSATIMVGCEGSKAAYEYARENRKRFSFGLHFNIVDGFAPAANQANSLCDESGSFRESDDQRLAAMWGRLTVADIRREFRLQLEELRDNYVEVTHIDSHGHLHKFPAIIYSLRSEMRRAGVTWVRRPQNVFLRPNGKRRVINNVFAIPFWGLMRTDYYCAVDSGDEMWAKRLPELLPEGLTEVSVHPGRNEAWRYNEASPLLKPDEFRRALNEAGIELTRYRAFG
ncbi:MULTISPECIES: ChbG/HpnK family deacetylase [unclassified Cupriavidus]|uniref:ChbG/HpnK family deacetylase n=1 Tax=unclassified Cupriavidus TaxID=2640874 RepID=UPI001365586B|nr:ChbG/HpnK family deacetylase [Cupriavidus sp. SW-Y-13]MWL88290.1 ChbG/HpnK family deacetylase [Cupriavidus sp. SW-Y-13]